MRNRVISILMTFIMVATMINVLGEMVYAEKTTMTTSTGGFEMYNINVSNKSPEFGEEIKFSCTIKAPDNKKIVDIQYLVQRGKALPIGTGDVVEKGTNLYNGGIYETVNYYGEWQLKSVSVTCADGTTAEFYDSSTMAQEEMHRIQKADNEYYVDMSGSRAIVKNSPNDNEPPVIDANSASASSTEGKLGENFVMGIKISDNVGISEVYSELSFGEGAIFAENFYYNKKTGYWEDKIIPEYYGKYEIVSITAVDTSGNQVTLYNNKYSNYYGYTPAANLSGANHFVNSKYKDFTPPTVYLNTLKAKKTEIGFWKNNKIQMKIHDNSKITMASATVKQGAGGLCGYGLYYNKDSGYYEIDLEGQFYGNWELIDIFIWDEYGNKTHIFNSNCIDGKNPLVIYDGDQIVYDGEDDAIHKDLRSAMFYVGIEDAKTNIFVSGDGMDKTASLKTQKRKHEGTEYKRLNDTRYKDIGYFNIKMGGNYVKDGKDVRTRFEPDNVVDGNIVTIKHLLSDGSVQKKTCTVKNGQIDISVDEFSPFLLEMDSSLKENQNYTIKYILNKGKNNVSNPTIYSSALGTSKFKSPTRKGYDFKGWYLDKKYKKRITSITKGSKGNKTLYAKWGKTKVSIPKNIKTIAGKKALTVKYSSVKGANGYSIKYSLKRSMKSSKTITVKSNKYTIKKLKAKKKYYIKVRAYKLDSTGKKVYSKWSKVKSKKIK